ncbi:oxidoreductase [Massilia sp. TSP1-1-2]|uniref:oxidoreductase n=1 Tax=unclassified Massilia TaxID=2609279 RepID=UPI003CE977DF
MQNLHVGVVGYGYASATFHIPLIRATPGLTLSCIASSKAPITQQALPDVAVAGSPAALFANSDIDLVVIATPNDTHYRLAAAALEAGKHVVVDKPFALDVAEASRLIALAERHGRQLSVFHNRRWDGDFLGVARLIDSGQLGAVRHFESHFDRYRPVVLERWRESAAAGGGLWYDLGIHLADQALQLFGRPSTVWLDLQRQRDGALADDWFHAVLHYAGLRVILHASALAAAPAPRFVLHGTAGSFVKYGLDTQEAALKRGERPGSAGWGDDPLPGTLTLGQVAEETLYPGQAGDYTVYYAAMRDAINLGTPLPVTPQSACDALEIIELGLDSARSGRVVKLPPR